MIQDLGVIYSDVSTEEGKHPFQRVHARMDLKRPGQYFVNEIAGQYYFTKNDLGRSVKYRFRHAGLELHGEVELRLTHFTAKVPKVKAMTEDRVSLKNRNQDVLTEIDKKILSKVMAGKTYREIATELGVTSSFVTYNVNTSIYPKLGINRREELIPIICSAVMERVRDREKSILDVLSSAVSRLELFGQKAEADKVRTHIEEMKKAYL